MLKFWLVLLAVSNALSTDPPPICTNGLSPDSVIWKSNQTHELHVNLIEKNKNCSGAPCTNQPDKTIDLQSGDVLLVYINETVPTTPPGPSTATQPPVPSSAGSTISPASTAGTTPSTLIPTSSPLPVHSQIRVFSVSRPGPVDCDESEGVALDLSPVLYEGTNLLTFYDKDLTDGINMLLIVSGTVCTKLKITVKSENCGEGEDCNGKGACYTKPSMADYQCECCPGYIGPHCEEKDACYQSPCKNNGICVDISQGHEGSTFQCLCPYGFTGKLCEDTSDPCNNKPCKNGGECHSSNETAQQFKCVCTENYTGHLCETARPGACTSSPCLHGICVDQPDSGYRCFCQPGFTGSQCQEEYNECDSSPCLNGGTCFDRINNYTCTCDRGYTGERCQTKKDLCKPNPCSHRHICKDKGNTYTCECPKGYTGTSCMIPTRAPCSSNPCRNGGTCWSSVDSFYCACRPGYTGKICNEEVIIEVIPSASETIEVDDPNVELVPIEMRRGLDSSSPLSQSIHLDHLHNVYVAAGTLGCAVLIVVVTVIICHCRMHETYKHCCFRSSPILPCSISRFDSVINKNGMERDKEPLAKSRPFPALDSDMYYALDFSDSQSSPLIQ